MMIEYARVRENTRPPVRSNPSDAGLDVFYCPVDTANSRSPWIYAASHESVRRCRQTITRGRSTCG